MERVIHRDVSIPLVAGGAYKVAYANPRRTFFQVQRGDNVAGFLYVYLGDPSGVPGMRLTSVDDVFVLDKTAMWRGEIFVATNVDGVHYVLTTEISE
jgi:hypothetical protein